MRLNQGGKIMKKTFAENLNIRDSADIAVKQITEMKRLTGCKCTFAFLVDEPGSKPFYRFTLVGDKAAHKKLINLLLRMGFKRPEQSHEGVSFTETLSFCEALCDTTIFLPDHMMQNTDRFIFATILCTAGAPCSKNASTVLP